ncbi:MAG: protein translocase subunit SecF [Halanaerobiales bacterium]
MFDRITGLSSKQMIAIPLIFFILMATVGLLSPPSLGIDLKGGSRVTITGVDDNPTQLEDFLQGEMSDSRISVRTLEGASGIVIEAPSGIEQDRLTNLIKGEIDPPEDSISSEEIGASFGRSTQIQGLKALGVAFLGMIIIVFITFRDIIPSLTIIYCSFSDMVISFGLMSILGIPLTLGTIASLLMLIGYAVDSNILLTTRILKRSGKYDDKYSNALKTGLMMGGTTLSVLLVVYIINSSQILDSIVSVLMLGIIADLINTWLFNAGILRWRTEEMVE